MCETRFYKISLFQSKPDVIVEFQFCYRVQSPSLGREVVSDIELRNKDI
jgi:hypothetical protein